MQTLTRGYLATYVYLRSEIKRIQGKIKYYENHPVQQRYGAVKDPMKQFPSIGCHFVVSSPTIKSNSEREKIVRQLTIDLKGNEQLFEDMRLDIETFLETLPAEDIEVRHTSGSKYVERKSDGEIAKKLNCGRRTIGLKIGKFPNAI